MAERLLLSEQEQKQIADQIPAYFRQFASELDDLEAIGIAFRAHRGESWNVIEFYGSSGESFAKVPSVLEFDTEKGRIEIATELESSPDLLSRIEFYGRLFTDLALTALRAPLRYASGFLKTPRFGGGTPIQSGGGKGTMGGIVTDRSGNHHLITCAHVVESCQPTPGDHRPHDSIQVYNVISHGSTSLATSAISTVFIENKQLMADAARARVVDNDLVTRKIGPHDPTGTGEPTRKLFTHNRSAVRTSVGLTGRLLYEGCNKYYEFTHAIRTSNIGKKGDSGSLVLNEHRQIVGVLFWVARGAHCYVCSIENVKKALEIEDSWKWND